MWRALSVALVIATSALGETKLPFDVGGPFRLTDQTGQIRTEADPKGNPQLLFFGYANCEQICSAALPLMADAADLLEQAQIDLSLVMITVDPSRDTVATIGPALFQIRPDFTGLTGSATALQVAYDAFNVETELLFTDPAGNPVYSHGSFLYLLDGQGKVLALLPPILSADRVAEIIRTHIRPSG